MSEIGDLIAVYGAIDQAVQKDPDRRAAVSQLLPFYRDPDVHWFDDFETWTRELVAKRGQAAAQPLPTLNQALIGLAEIRPRCRMRARRLYAIASAAQAFPELQGLETETAALAQRALRFDEAADERAKPLLLLLGELPGIDGGAGDLDGWWQALLDSGSIVNSEGIGPRPTCSGRLVMVDLPGGPEPVPTFDTEFETNLAFNDAVKFLKPEAWKACSHFWCVMREVGQRNGIHEYHEVVSLDCDNRDRTWTLEADLDFHFSRPADDVAITEYQLKDGLPQQDVRVDAGSLVVRRIPSDDGPRTRVKTTKRILFSGPFDGAILASIMCYVGYLSFVEDLLCCAATDEDPDAAYPVRQPADTSRRRKRGAAAPNVPGVAKFMTDEVVPALEACIEECAEAVQKSLEKIDEGSYDADALVQDIASMWTRMLREGATVADVGLRSARMGTRTRDRSGTDA